MSGGVESNLYKVSIRHFAEFLEREGDLYPDYGRSPTATEGIRGHQKIQATRKDPWKKEVSVAKIFTIRNFNIELKGRVDLVEPISHIIEEVKTCYSDRSISEEHTYKAHWAQLMIYAYIYMCDKKLSNILIKLTYFALDSEQATSYERKYCLDDITCYVNSLLERYSSWLTIIQKQQNSTKLFLKNMTFPFKEYRPFQYEMAREIFLHCRDSKHLLFEAPTGTGKTLTAVYPSLKALSEEIQDQLCIVTTKGTTQQEMLRTFESIAFKKVLTIQAKSKACHCLYEDNNPSCCIKTVGFWDRLPQALEEFIGDGNYTNENLQACCIKYQLCPFQFSLCAVPWVQVIILDCNYIFDPCVQLTFFNESNLKRVFLFDEVHNLDKRILGMYSETLEQRLLIKCSQLLIDQELKKILLRLHRYLQKWKPNNARKNFKTIFKHLERIWEYRALLDQKIVVDDTFIENFFRKLYRFYVLLHTMNDSSTIFKDSWAYKEKEYYQINIVCLSPTAVCKSRLNTMKTFIGFSATISPFSYYSNILGLDDASKFSLPSSFPKEHLKVIIANNFDTRYYSREAALPNILDLFNKLQEYKKGKYIFFFPSYEFLNQFKNYLMKNAIMSESEVIIQSVNDDNEDRKVFINTFLQNSGPLTGLAILGGIYSEGIDFTGNSLDGVIILGTGIANPGHTEETRKKYYDHLGVNGFDYVFRFPGMTRVVQAAGRVIRSKYDKGFVILADFRFSKQKYRELMPVTWDCLKSESNKQTIELLGES